MNEQPKSLRLADEKRSTMPLSVLLLWGEEAAAELRRLHAVNAEMLDALEKLHEAQKRAENLPIFADTYAQESVRFLLYDGMIAARAAIAKATGDA